MLIYIVYMFIYMFIFMFMDVWLLDVLKCP